MRRLAPRGNVLPRPWRMAPRPGWDGQLSAGAAAVNAGPPGPWWAIAAALLAAALGLVVAGLAASHSAGHLVDGPPPITVAGDHFKLVRGRGQPSKGAYVLEALDPKGLCIVAAGVPPFAAESYPRVEWQLRGADAAGMKLLFVWRTLERPKRNFHVELEWQGGNVVYANPSAADGWSGTITGVALVVQGNLAQPLVLQSWTAPSASAWTALTEIGRQWSVPFPFKGATISFPFDAERSDFASLLIVVAAAQGLALAGYYLLARRRGWPRDARVLWAVFLIGWLILDLRWQANLWRQLAQTTRQFAGKTPEEKHLATDDHAVFELMRQVNAALPAPPVRIHFLADDLALRTRAAFFLYPQNVYHDVGRGLTAGPEQVRSGDFVLLFWFHGLAYDRQAQQLRWPDGSTRAADEILALADGVLLVRAR